MPKTKIESESDELNIALGELGVSESEKQLYRLSVMLGPISVQELARQLGLQRPYVYTLIQNLREIGLASGASSKYLKTFVVESPSVVLELLRRKKSTIDNLSVNLAESMPKFLAEYRQGTAKTQVKFYEGRSNFIKLYDRILDEEGSETLYFGEAEYFLTLIGEIKLAHWIDRRIEKGVNVKTLMVDSLQAHNIPSDRSQLRETRIITEDIKLFPASFQVFGRSIIFWQPHTPMAVVLEDEYIAQLMRGIFALLWERGKRI